MPKHGYRYKSTHPVPSHDSHHEAGVHHAHHLHKPGHRGAPSKTHPHELDYTTKKGDKDYHQKKHDILKVHAPYSTYHHHHPAHKTEHFAPKHHEKKGDPSKTRPHHEDYETHKGDKVYDEGGKWVHKKHAPYFKH